MVHSDNGSPMKGSSIVETVYQLGFATSFSRPRVSNDNAYAESIFKTCKYRHDYHYKKFSSMDETREWVLKYNHWYNFIHKHSGIKFVTTHQRHAGLADKILAKKKEYNKVPKSEPHSVCLVKSATGIYPKYCT